MNNTRKKDAYSKLKKAEESLKKDYKQFASSRAAYYNALREYQKVDREEANVEVLPPKGEPRRNAYTQKTSKAYREAKRLLKEVGKEDFLKAIEEKMEENNTKEA